MTTGTELKDRGVDAVLAADTAPHRRYGDLAREALDAFVDAGIPFSAEDIRERVTRHHPTAVAHSPNVLPAVIAAASRAGRIVVVGATRPTRASRHGNRNLVWRAA